MRDHKSFPAFFYGPNGASKIFHCNEDIPEGWEDSPGKVSNAAHNEPEPNGGRGPDVDAKGEDANGSNPEPYGSNDHVADEQKPRRRGRPRKGGVDSVG